MKIGKINYLYFGYDNGTADVTKCSSKFFCNNRGPNVKTWRLAEFIFLNFFGKNLTIGAPIKIYRRRRVEFIGGGGVPAAAPTSEIYESRRWDVSRARAVTVSFFVLLCETTTILKVEKSKMA